MVTFDREEAPGGPTIRGFSGTAFRVQDRIVPGGLWLTPDNALDWSPPAIADLRASHVESLIDTSPQPEFLLLGTGPSIVRPSPTFVAEIEARGYGVEVMDSRSAARAWNVLRGEDRWIVAALMPL